MVTMAVFLPVIDLGFVNSDDPGYFSENPNVLAGLTWSGIRWAFQTHEVASPYPMTWLSFMLDAELFGKGPAGPHLTNLLIHVTNVVLLFLLLRDLTGAYWRSAIVAALFALHPLRVESVAWIAERKGVLSTTFAFLSVWAYVRYAKAGHPDRVQRDNPRKICNRLAWYGLALVLLALGLMSKPMLVTIPCVLLLLDYWPLQRFAQGDRSGQRTIWQLLLEKVPFLMLAVGSSWNQIRVEKEMGALSPLTSLPVSARIGNALVSYARYLGKTFWPTDLAFPYSHPGQWPMTEVALAAALVVLLCFFSIMQSRKRPWLLVGWLWFLGMLVPVLGLVQWGSQAMADRFTYMPLVGGVSNNYLWRGPDTSEMAVARTTCRAGIGARALGLCSPSAKPVAVLAQWRNSCAPCYSGDEEQL